MELVANVWPIVDQSGLVLRFLMRAYAMEASDETISDTLRALAQTDFVLGRAFVIPKQFTVVSEHGTISGCVDIGDFTRHQGIILDAAFRALEKEFAKSQGIRLAENDSHAIDINKLPSFSHAPYLVTTTLFESSDGQLTPMHGSPDKR
jgi:hypothetical protein